MKGLNCTTLLGTDITRCRIFLLVNITPNQHIRMILKGRHVTLKTGVMKCSLSITGVNCVLEYLTDPKLLKSSVLK